MRVTVDASRCQGHGLCAGIAEDVFELSDEDGHAFVPSPEVADADEVEMAHYAALACPEQAIVIDE